MYKKMQWNNYKMKSSIFKAAAKIILITHTHFNKDQIL